MGTGMQTVTTAKHIFSLIGDKDLFTSELTAEQVSEGVQIIRLRITSPEPAVPPVYKLKWEHPVWDIQNYWHPAIDRARGLKADWMRKLRSNAASSAPVISLFNLSGSNRLTFAFSDALNTVSYAAGIHEESAWFHCHVELFTETTPPLSSYEACLLVDTRAVAYYESLRDVQSWYAQMPEYRPAYVPPAALSPMYSTWYSMHQNVTAEAIELQCRQAKELGMEAVIVDDGWQTSDNRRGYAYTGDWEVCLEKFADMKQHVDRVHKLGMKFLLWYSVAHVGKHSKAWSRFQDKLLRFIESHGAGILDPRYPEVREHIITKYRLAVEEWGLDGFKLDFIDTFYPKDVPVPEPAAGMDYSSVPAAVDRLLTDSIARLREIKPDIMVEFRQPYIGPAMRKYGNLFRASDCPNDAVQNRLRTIDIRLLCGNTAAHADMIMWNTDEPVESAALQLTHILFSVPQVSVQLEKLTAPHAAMLRFWLSFYKEHRDVLLGGELAPEHPELNYPVVRAANGLKTIIVTYHDKLIPIREVRKGSELILVNGRLENGVYAEFPPNHPPATAVVRLVNCCGDTIHEYVLEVNAGVHLIDIPASGVALLTVE
ncbi:glycoside hydrolase family 36 protein [Paenibacillus silviterrae]|uniref:glycoside hydrolase family 36 protein n=1 Tax=Paenibacillus silviterrae TaxID=3242194 RepID=UPI002542EFD2|nr:glycoside hydrolase family 36 protein [Paenibacillus chinjuensis]